MKRMLVGIIIGVVIGCIVAVSITHFFHLTAPWNFINGLVCGIIFTPIGIYLSA